MSIFNTTKKGEAFKLIQIDLDSEKKVIVYHFENHHTDLANRITFQRSIPFADNSHIDLGELTKLLPDNAKLEL